MTKYERPRISVLPLLCLLLLWAQGCSRPERWNVLLVTFDTTRADHIGCYGNEDIETPNLDGLAAEGVRFARAFTTIPLTTPSHSTIMTGKYPIAHGVRDNGMFVLPESQETLAEILGERGWKTAAAIASFPLVKKFGVDQGFDFYDDHITQPAENFLGERVLPKSGLYFDERPAARVNEALYPWLEENHDQPFFVWAHYFDPHHPLAPPPPYDQLYAGRPYEGEIAYADESFGNLLDRLRRLGVYDRTLIIMTADHGEGNGEHNEITHSIQVYNSTLHVPLIVRIPGGPEGLVVDAPVGTVDLLSTVLELLDIPAPEGVQGRSLMPAIRGEEDPRGGEPLYAETLSPRLGFGWGELRALIQNEHKYIFGPRPELYDIGADPREVRDLVEIEAETATRMQRQLSRFLRDNAASDLDAAVDMDEETRQKLMALGYLNSSSGTQEKIEEVLRPDGVPPQDRVGDISELSTVKQMLFSRQPLAAREMVAGLLEKDPQNPLYLEMDATANLQLGRLEEALETIEKIGQLEAPGPATGKLQMQLGTLYMYGGEHEKAEALLRQSLEAESSELAHYLLANIYSSLGRPEDERAALEAALEVDPTYAPARVDLAIRNAQSGDRQGAAAEFQRAMRDQPYFHKAFYNYGTFLVESGELEAAIPHFRRSVELNPGYWQGFLALVSLHLTLEQPEEAQRHYRTLNSRAPASPEAQQARQLIEEAT